MKMSTLLPFNDNFSIGPISDLEKEKGQKARDNWFKSKIHDEEMIDYELNYKRAIEEINHIPNEIPIYVWVTENAHEQTGLLFTINLLKEKTNKIYIVNSTQLYKELFKQKAKRFIPRSLGEISIDDLKVIYQHAKNHNQKASKNHRRELLDKWTQITENETTLRIWKDREVQSVSEDYYDEFIVTKAKKLSRKIKGFIQATRLIGEVIGHLDQFIGDGFIEYRLRQLIKAEVFEYEGTLDGMIFYKVKLR
jgi:hypothetical protein